MVQGYRAHAGTRGGFVEGEDTVMNCRAPGAKVRSPSSMWKMMGELLEVSEQWTACLEPCFRDLVTFGRVAFERCQVGDWSGGYCSDSHRATMRVF